MLICLSSGSRPRYRQDVLRALALPVESQLQFRYDKSWVSNRVLQMIQSGEIIDQDVLITYADQSHPDDRTTLTGPIELVPIRVAKVVSAVAPGQTVSLLFSVGQVSLASNLGAFNSEVSNLTGEALPQWVEDTPKGLYCTEMGSKPTNFVEIDDLGEWEDLVTQLADRKDFEQEETFFTIIGLLTENELKEMRAALRHIAWPHSLPASAYRNLIVYHYHPTKAPSDLAMAVTAGPELKLASPTKARLDSRYDLKKFRVRSGDPSFGKQESWLNLTTEGSSISEPLELDMDVTVQGNLLKRLGVAAVIAAALAGAQAISLVSRVDLETGEKVLSAVGILLLSFVVGVAAVWGIRRSV